MLWEVRLSPGKWSRRALLASVMLVAVTLRGLIPPGFMPASDRPFSFEICWEGLPAGMLAQVEPPPANAARMESMESMDMASMPADTSPTGSIHESVHRDARRDFTSHGGLHQGAHHHPGSPPQSEHCVFGTACSAGPIPHLPLPGDFSSVRESRAVAFASTAATARAVHLPQPRAPPGRLS
jgi:hypothetical protein